MGKVIVGDTTGVITGMAKFAGNDLPKGADLMDAMRAMKTYTNIAEARIAGIPLEKALEGTPYEAGEAKPTPDDGRHQGRVFDDLGLGQR